MVLENHSDGHNPESDESSFGYETCIQNSWPGNCGCFTKVNQLRIVSFQVLMAKLSEITVCSIHKYSYTKGKRITKLKPCGSKKDFT